MMNDRSITRAPVATSVSVALKNPFVLCDSGSAPADAAVYRQFNDAIPRKLILRAFLVFTGVHITFIVSLLFLYLRS